MSTRTTLGFRQKKTQVRVLSTFLFRKNGGYAYPVRFKSKKSVSTRTQQVLAAKKDREVQPTIWSAMAEPDGDIALGWRGVLAHAFLSRRLLVAE
jgi:hypothetical protein